MCPRHPPRVTTVWHVAAFVKVNAKNDVDKDVHFRAPGSVDRTLCGMQVADAPAKGEMSCTRCHQFASGNI
jgi:hypothetical protein